jgi:hypothetical protein
LLVQVDPASSEIVWAVSGNGADGSVGIAFDAIWVTSVALGKVWRIDL